MLAFSAASAQSPNWNQIIKAAASDRGQSGIVTDRLADDQFGWAAAIDGDYAVVGAHQEDENAVGGATLAFAGSAYVFKQTAGVWSLQQKLVPSDRAAGDYFGWSVGISGNQIIVGHF
ncbi:MAG: FG-GAP repeat protein [Bacteroidetes bacterium]|nr:FG-GAP repeat protein [Bacteroidota bacterium]